MFFLLVSTGCILHEIYALSLIHIFMDDLYETMEATCYEKLKAISICDVVKELEQLYALKENTNERR